MYKKIIQNHYLLFLSLFLFLIGAWVFTRGMFFDGQQYAIVALNMAKHKGSFWFPFVTESWPGIRNHAFLEQFTLGYWIESWWFYFLPTSNYTEKFFCACCCIFNAYWLVKLCKAIAEKQNINAQSFAVFTIIIWLLIPTVFWSFSNNVLEILMSVFCTMAVYFQYKSIQSNSILHVILAGLLIVASLFSKGLPALFVLSFYAVSVLFGFVSIKKALMYTLIQIGILLIIFLLLFQIPDAKESITYYITQRLLSRIQSSPTVSNRFTILFYFFNDAIVGIILIALSIFTKNRLTSSSQKKQSLFWFLFCLTGVLPIMLTKIQKSFYITQIFPFFAIAIGLFCMPLFDKWLQLLQKNLKAQLLFKYTINGLMCTAIIFCATQYNGYVRHKTLLKEIDNIALLINKNTKVSLAKSLHDDWGIYFYLTRFANTSGMFDTNQNYIVARTTDSLPANFKPLQQFNMLQVGVKK